jgi:hypothetical protein
MKQKLVEEQKQEVSQTSIPRTENFETKRPEQH